MKKITPEQFLQRFNDNFSHEWEALDPFISMRKKMHFRHKQCGVIIYQTPNTFLNKKGRSCRTCYSKSRFLTIEDFIEKANVVHPIGQFDYSKVIYLGNKHKVIITCNKHNIEFEQEPRNHWIGHGCEECTKEKLSIALLNTKDEFIETAISIHGNLYGYDKVIYIDNNTNIEILCILCNKYFWQLPRSHISGSGCQDCARRNQAEKMTNTFEDFIERAKNIHPDGKYIYDPKKFNGTTLNRIDIYCTDCSKWFPQRPIEHLQGNGCPYCWTSISKEEVYWLDYLKVPEEYRQKQFKVNGKLYRYDAYDPSTNTIYEFHGDWWHGNINIYDPSDWHPLAKKTFGELYANTIQKENDIRADGYNLISIWETDFNKIVKQTTGYSSIYKIKDANKKIKKPKSRNKAARKT